MKVHVVLLSLSVFLVACSPAMRFPEHRTSCLPDGVEAHYLMKVKGEEVRLYPFPADSSRVLSFREGVAFRADPGLRSGNEMRVRGEFHLDDLFANRQYTILASVQYPNDLFSSDSDIIPRETGDFAVLEGDKAIGLVSYDPNRLRHHYDGYWLDWHFRYGHESGRRGLVLEDNEGAVACFAESRGRITVLFRPNLTDEDQHRAMTIHLLAESLGLFVRFHNSAKDNTSAIWPINTFIWTPRGQSFR